MKEFTIQNLLKLFFLKKKFIISTTFLIVALIIIFSFIMPHKYSSESTLMPDAGKSGNAGLAGMLSNMPSTLSLGGIGKDDKSLLFSEILTSKSVAEYAIQKHNLDKNDFFKYEHYLELIDELRKSIYTDVLKSGVTLVSVSLKTKWFPSKADSDSIAKLTSIINNTLVEGLDSVLTNQSISSAKQSRLYINREISDYTFKLDSLERVIQRFQENNNVLELTEQTTSIAKQGLEIIKELSVSELEYNLAKQIYADDAPQLSAFKEKYEILKEQYSKSQKGGLVPTDKFSLPLDSIPELIRVYYDLMRKREIMEHVIIYLQTQYFQEAIQEKKDVAEVVMLDNARVPYKRAAPVRSLMLMIGSIVTLLLVLSFVTIKAFIKGDMYISKSE